MSRLHAVFPNLLREGYQETSPPSRRYNCIAWAAGDQTRWWWPAAPPYCWPDGVPLEDTVEAFIQAYGTLGYTPCLDGTLEPGYEKVVLYAIGAAVKHAARQLLDGQWTSKLGPDIDIEHTLAGVAGTIYGTPVQFLKRPFAVPATANEGPAEASRRVDPGPVHF